MARRARLPTAASSAKSASHLGLSVARGAPAAVLAAHQVRDRLALDLGAGRGVVAFPAVSAGGAARGVVGAAHRPGCALGVPEGGVASVRDAVRGVAEPHDRRAGAARDCPTRRRPSSLAYWRALPALLAVGAPSVAQLPAAHRSALVGAMLLLGARENREAGVRLAGRGDRRQRRGQVPGRQREPATCSSAPCLRSASQGLSAGCACRPSCSGAKMRPSGSKFFEWCFSCVSEGDLGKDAVCPAW